jgi:cytoskeleton protein RodZ
VAQAAPATPPPAPAPAPATTSAKQPAASPAPSPLPAKGPDAASNRSTEPTLKFVFKGQSWVEVRDSKGRLLFSRLNPAGSTEEVSGKPPFNVVVGNAPEVQLYYNDHEFDLEPHTKVAVARFTVE